MHEASRFLENGACFRSCFLFSFVVLPFLISLFFSKEYDMAVGEVFDARLSFVCLVTTQRCHFPLKNFEEGREGRRRSGDYNR